MIIELSPKMVARTFGWTIVALVGLHLLDQGSLLALGNTHSSMAYRFLNLDQEANLPTFFNTILLLVSAALLFVAAVGYRRRCLPYGYWLALGIIFLFLAADEAFVMHEQLIGPIKLMVDLPPYLEFAWVIPYGLGVVVLAGVYCRFLLRLPSRTYRLIITAGSLYVLGAIGFEMLGAWHFSHAGRDAVYCLLLVTIEESLEMGGLVIFIFALMEYIDLELGGLRLRF